MTRTDKTTYPCIVKTNKAGAQTFLNYNNSIHKVAEERVPFIYKEVTGNSQGIYIKWQKSK